MNEPRVSAALGRSFDPAPTDLEAVLLALPQHLDSVVHELEVVLPTVKGRHQGGRKNKERVGASRSVSMDLLARRRRGSTHGPSLSRLSQVTTYRSMLNPHPLRRAR